VIPIPGGMVLFPIKKKREKTYIPVHKKRRKKRKK